MRVTPEKIKSKLFELQFRLGRLDTLLISYGLAHYVVSEIMGLDWVNSKLTPFGSTHDTFFKPKPKTTLEVHQQQGRLMEFADILYSLQDMEGFEDKILELTKISSKNRLQHIEDIVMELSIAKMIFKKNPKSKFIAPINAQGVRTPDLKISIPKGDVFAEIKCRRESNPTSRSWLKNNLYDAGNQLKNSPVSQKAPTGIFLRVGTYLKDSNDGNADREKITNDFFSNFTNVNFVYYLWEEWIINPDNSGGVLDKFKYFHNPDSIYPLEGTDTIIQEVNSVEMSADGNSVSYSYLGPTRNQFPKF